MFNEGERVVIIASADRYAFGLVDHINRDESVVVVAEKELDGKTIFRFTKDGRGWGDNYAQLHTIDPEYESVFIDAVKGGDSTWLAFYAIRKAKQNRARMEFLSWFMPLLGDDMTVPKIVLLPAERLRRGAEALVVIGLKSEKVTKSYSLGDESAIMWRAFIGGIYTNGGPFSNTSSPNDNIGDALFDVFRYILKEIE